MKQDKSSEAEPYLREAMEKHRTALGNAHRDTLKSISSMGNLLIVQGKLSEAEPFFREVLNERRRALAPEDPDTLTAVGFLANTLLKIGTETGAAEAETLFRDSLAIRQRLYPDGHPEAPLGYVTMSLLGDALACQHKFDEAEPFLLNGYKGLRDDPQVPIPASVAGRQRDALKRIVKLYKSWDKAKPGNGYDVKAAEWELKLQDTNAGTPTNG